jgi:hypothetical protein
MLLYAMPRNARIPKVDRTDPRLREIARLMGELADERSGPSADPGVRSAAFDGVARDVLQDLARQRAAQKHDVDDD